jgi:hypothetical protein
VSSTGHAGRIIKYNSPLGSEVNEYFLLGESHIPIRTSWSFYWRTVVIFFQWQYNIIFTPYRSIPVSKRFIVCQLFSCYECSCDTPHWTLKHFNTKITGKLFFFFFLYNFSGYTLAYVETLLRILMCSITMETKFRILIWKHCQGFHWNINPIVSVYRLCTLLIEDNTEFRLHFILNP